MPVVKQLYDEITEITEDYLGPAAQRFIDRQIQNHLHKQIKNLTNKELLLLTDWLIISLGLLTSDKKIKSEYAKRLKRLVADGKAN